MSLKIMWKCAKVPPSRVTRYRVRCTLCGLCYVTTAWRHDIERRSGCASCALRRRRRAG